jgi:hypothetical protein
VLIFCRGRIFFLRAHDLIISMQMGSVILFLEDDGIVLPPLGVPILSGSLIGVFELRPMLVFHLYAVFPSVPMRVAKLCRLPCGIQVHIVTHFGSRVWFCA